MEMVENLWDVCKQLVRTVSHSTSLAALERAFENRDFKTYISYFFAFYIFTFGAVACFDIISVVSLFYRFFIICHSSHLPRIHGFSGLRERGCEDL